MMNKIKKTAKFWLGELATPLRARRIAWSDRRGLSNADPGPERVITEGLSWLCHAQDMSASHDAGVARHFSLVGGWANSYPETTGYIVDTLLSVPDDTSDARLVKRARGMLDWLVSIQFPDGAFQGGLVDQVPRVPTTFNTGQILIGLAAGTKLDAKYREPMMRAADWLVTSQDSDGAWRKHATPFAAPGDKAYETHVSIGLFRAAQLEQGRGYLEAARRQVDWALGRQKPNGWFADCCLTDPQNPLTHTLGYALRGVVEAYLSTGEERYLAAACRTADGVMSAFEPAGRLAGRLNESWQPAADWVCLTGTSQIAESLLLLAGPSRREDYRRTALLANSFVRRTIEMDGSRDIRGAVKGSFPVDGWYGKWQYLNWACKFTIDANRAELKYGR
jgi:rhamnogalacturonyl hydrolase YesR